MKRYIKEKWSEAVLRVPELKAMENSTVAEAIDGALEMVDSMPGYRLFNCYLGGFESETVFVFVADDEVQP